MVLKLKPRPLYLRFSRMPLALMMLTIAADQASKGLVVRTFPGVGSQRVIIPHFFSLVHFRNPGAAWGMFSHFPGVLTGLSLLVFCGAIVWFRKLSEGIPIRALALGVILGGIGGNLIDRICRHEVVDFLLFYWRDYRWPAFNLADTAISCGIVLYILSSFFQSHEADDHEAPESADGR